jgi:hypothetical protein
MEKPHVELTIERAAPCVRSAISRSMTGKTSSSENALACRVTSTNRRQRPACGNGNAARSVAMHSDVVLPGADVTIQFGIRHEKCQRVGLADKFNPHCLRATLCAPSQLTSQLHSTVSRRPSAQHNVATTVSDRCVTLVSSVCHSICPPLSRIASPKIDSVSLCGSRSLAERMRRCRFSRRPQNEVRRAVVRQRRC